LIDEGLAVVEAIRARFDGARRNPWNEQECGHHYARAMASWAVPLALSGFRYSAVSQTLALAPHWNPEAFRSFWCVSAGWGMVEQTISDAEQNVRWEVLHGALALRRLRCTAPAGRPAAHVELAGAGAGQEFTWQQTNDEVEIELAETLRVVPSQPLTITVW
ncbi:MAG: hypothetical protein GX601_07165, partial [Anaerolineales bacterium]|nr:hypothetical protein [Anaerolineales bacterium]